MMRRRLSILMTALFTAFFLVGCVENNINNGNGEEDEFDAFTVSQQATIERLQTTDSLGRYFTETDGLDETKDVGIFYFLWMGQHDNGASYDSARLSEYELKENRSTVGVFHYWDEPLYDYYNSEDPWVFRKHLELFIMAGIDYLVFDVSNSYYYKVVCESIFPVALEVQAQGWKVPKFIFYCHNKTKSTVTGIYNDFYDPNNPECRKYDSLWYDNVDNGERNTAQKPWILVKNNGVGTDPSNTQNLLQNFDACSQEIRDFFYTRELWWNQEHEENREYVFPSDIDNPAVHAGMISVSVAQHNSGAFSDSVFETNARDSNRGRGWSKQQQSNIADAVYLGSNYRSEWEYAFSFGDEVNNIFLSTWNEWIAQKQPYGLHGRSTCYFVDQFNAEFSRDIEMTKGLWGDNYYLQTISMVRQFKSINTGKKFTPKRIKIDLGGVAEQWADTVGYLDLIGDTAERNHKSANLNPSVGNVPSMVYMNTTGRNDIRQTNITYDSDNVYIRVQCADTITPYQNGDRTWMNIFIEVDGLSGTQWENYQYVINRTVNAERTSIERLKSDGNSTVVGLCEYDVTGDVMTVKIPRNYLQIADDKSFTLNFKIADNVTDYTNIMDYYVNGDSAPIGRLNYVFSI